MPTKLSSSILGVLVALGVAAASPATGVPDPTGWIVFSASPDGLPPPQLFRVETTGTGLQQITTGGKGATDPAFSPDGTRIVFARLSSGIFVIGLDGSGLRRLTSGARDQFPVWSPDGRHIAFIRVYRSEWRLYVMNASGRAQRRLSLAPPAGRPSWTSDSRSIFIPLESAVEKVDARTGRAQRRVVLNLDLASGQAATLSPNSRRVAFVGPRPSTPNCEEVTCAVFGLYVADLPSGRRRRFANDAGPAGWSPDGRTLVFVYRGALALWPVVSGTRMTISTGSSVAEGNAPPAWRPR